MWLSWAVNMRYPRPTDANQHRWAVQPALTVRNQAKYSGKPIATFATRAEAITYARELRERNVYPRMSDALRVRERSS